MRILPLLFLASFALAACEETPPPAYAPVPPPEPPPPPAAGAADQAPPAQDIPIGVDPDAYADTDPSALTDYRATLDPYGTWDDDPDYGTVWVPNQDAVGSDFVPYVSSGHWVYDDDYVWVSDYEWGWVPFHYGRWVWIGGHGWAWVPGRVYAGAWVVWRVGDDEWGYVGWAPMPPLWIWRRGVAVGIGFVPWEPYSFCARGDIFAPVVATHVVVGERAAVIAAHTRPYVQASPTVAAGHPFAQPLMHGPSPASLHIDPATVSHATTADRGLSHARDFAHPSTAQPLGAHPPTPHVVQSRPMVMPPHYHPAPVPHYTPHPPTVRGGGKRR
jgi:Family of unknown function (DUF6600)